MEIASMHGYLQWDQYNILQALTQDLPIYEPEREHICL